jgi:hypothetical protein
MEYIFTLCCIFFLRGSNCSRALEYQSSIDSQNLVFEASSGLITQPFIVTNGYICQFSTSDGVTNSGRAAYTFKITNPGRYVVRALVNAPENNQNSFRVNADNEPRDESMIWDIPLTDGFEERFVSGRGGRASAKEEISPRFFDFARGTHQLIIRGRDAGTQLMRVAIVRVPNFP